MQGMNKASTRPGPARPPQMGEFEALDSSDRADRQAARRRAEAWPSESPVSRRPAAKVPDDGQPELAARRVRMFM